MTDIEWDGEWIWDSEAGKQVPFIPKRPWWVVEAEGGPFCTVCAHDQGDHHGYGCRAPMAPRAGIRQGGRHCDCPCTTGDEPHRCAEADEMREILVNLRDAKRSKKTRGRAAELSRTWNRIDALLGEDPS